MLNAVTHTTVNDISHAEESSSSFLHHGKSAYMKFYNSKSL